MLRLPLRHPRAFERRQVVYIDGNPRPSGQQGHICGKGAPASSNTIRRRVSQNR